MVFIKDCHVVDLNDVGYISTRSSGGLAHIVQLIAASIKSASFEDNNIKDFDWGCT